MSQDSKYYIIGSWSLCLKNLFHNIYKYIQSIINLIIIKFLDNKEHLY